MAKATSFKANFGRLPGRVRAGSPAFFRKATTKTAQADMAAIIQRYDGFIKHLQGVTPEAIYDALEPVFDKSQEYVPKATGLLAESAEMNINQLDNGRIEGEITYGSTSAWYAALVHELVYVNHEPPTRSKYLQAALEEEMDNFLTSILLHYTGVFK